MENYNGLVLEGTTEKIIDIVIEKAFNDWMDDELSETLGGYDMQEVVDALGVMRGEYNRYLNVIHEEEHKDLPIFGLFNKYTDVSFGILENALSLLQDYVDDTSTPYNAEQLDAINQSLEKRYKFTHCDSEWHFKFAYDVDGICRFDDSTQTVVFLFSKKNVLLNELLKGVINPQNNIDVIIRPIIDVFRMDAKDESTTSGVKTALRTRVKRLNDYYCDAEYNKQH